MVLGRRQYEPSSRRFSSQKLLNNSSHVRCAEEYDALPHEITGNTRNDSSSAFRRFRLLNHVAIPGGTAIVRKLPTPGIMRIANHRPPSVCHQRTTQLGGRDLAAHGRRRGAVFTRRRERKADKGKLHRRCCSLGLKLFWRASRAVRVPAVQTPSRRRLAFFTSGCLLLVACNPRKRLQRTHCRSHDRRLSESGTNPTRFGNRSTAVACSFGVGVPFSYGLVHGPRTSCQKTRRRGFWAHDEWYKARERCLQNLAAFAAGFSVSWSVLDFAALRWRQARTIVSSIIHES